MVDWWIGGLVGVDLILIVSVILKAFCNPSGRILRPTLGKARIFHSEVGQNHANHCSAGFQACATTVEYRRVSRRIVARLQRLMATVAANPGRCPGLSCGGLSGLVFAPPFWKKEAMDLPLTERLRGCDTAGWEACAIWGGKVMAGFTMKYPG